MSESNGSFWTTLPGILTGLASVIAAVTGLVVALNGGDPTADANVANSRETVVASPVAEKPPAVSLQVNQPAQVATNNVSQLEKEMQAQQPQVDDPVSSVDVAMPLHQVVDCNSDKILNNSVGSLMSWSNHYFNEAQAHQGSSSQRYDCEKLLQYRASAWCKNQAPKIRSALVDSLKLCGVNSTLVAWYKAK